jgi:DNA invertase Pin-like site-specific DNA recombinase
MTILHPHPNIRPTHWQRLACIYIRQSSPKQVMHNVESQQLQYQLTQRATALGWTPERIRVIDTDQGQSGRGSTYRDGYQELVTSISMGHVGILFGYQVSRLARNNSDWYHLLDLAALFDTLIADSDGIYDLRHYNDRLLLGLKGTMSEAELHLMRQRLEAGRLNQVYRGAYQQRLPTGLIRTPDGQVMKDPDNQVRHTLELVFARFAELGSCSKVLTYLNEEQIFLPRHQTAGAFKGEIRWKRPSRDMIYEMLRNPAYAGAFAYGRKQVDYSRQTPGKPATGRLARPMDEWLHLQQDAYPAYISWEQYLANQNQLKQSAMQFQKHLTQAQGRAGHGSALLQGLVSCGHCGCAMKAGYKQSPYYWCEARRSRFGPDERTCIWARGPEVEAVVVQAFFEAIQPAQIDLLETVLGEQQREHTRLAQHWHERLTRAEYEVHRAQRQYETVDPENRLVAAELERRWEASLRQLQTLREEHDRFQQRATFPTLSSELRDQLAHISETLPILWPTLDNMQKKELLRSLIARVILKREEASQIEVRIVWISGHYTTRWASPPVMHRQDSHRYPEMVDRIQVLWQQGHRDEHIAKTLSDEGYRSARRSNVAPLLVQTIRLENGWHSALSRNHNALMVDGYLTVKGLAAELDLDQSQVYRLIYNKTVDPEAVKRDPHSGVYLICNDPDLIARLHQRRTTKKISFVKGAS